MAGRNLILASNPTRKRRTAAQKAASKRNIKKAQAARRRSPTRRRSSVKKRRRRSNTATPARKRSYRRRSNPTFSFKGIVDRQLIPAMVGGSGAVLNDLLVNFIPFLPPQFKVGWMRHITKAVGAIGISVVGGMFLNRRTADQLGAGAMTVVGYNVVRDLAANFAPQIPLGEYLPMGEYLDPALGYYGAGLNPSTVPGSGLETGGQFTRGSPYMGPADMNDELEAWPTGGTFDDLQY